MEKTLCTNKNISMNAVAYLNYERSIPPVQLVGLVVPVVPQDLHVVEHPLDDLLRPLELSFDLVAVVLGVLREKSDFSLIIIFEMLID